MPAIDFFNECSRSSQVGKLGTEPCGPMGVPPHLLSYFSFPSVERALVEQALHLASPQLHWDFPFCPEPGAQS